MNRTLIKPNLNYILRDDVTILSVSDFAPDMQSKIDAGKDDFTVTSRVARAPSSVINKKLAQYLEHFRTPQTIVDATIGFSKTTKEDPKALLGEVLPIMQSLYYDNFLIEANDTDIKNHEANYKKGEKIDEYKIEKCLQTLSDTDVYLAKSKHRKLAVLKMARDQQDNNESISKKLDKEARILKRLDGLAAPRLLAQGSFENRDYIALEYIAGLSSETIMQSLYFADESAFNHAAKTIALNILKAYQHIHTKNILHADIHPNNIIVNPNTYDVRIIDFGESYFADNDNEKYARNGIAFFYEPELAKALLDDKKAPPPTFLSEQYAIAATLYIILTGHHYIDFPLKQKDMQMAILHEKPAPLSHFIGFIPKNIERALLKALSKNSDDRFNNMDEFITAIEQKQTHTRTPKIPAINLPFLKNLEEQYTLTTEDMFLSEQPFLQASIPFGASGMAYYFYRRAQLYNAPRDLAYAEIWSDRAIEYAKYKNGLYAKEHGIEEQHLFPYAFHLGIAGTYIVDTLIQSLSHKTARIEQNIKQLKEGFLQTRTKHNKLDLDWNGGVIGYVYGMIYLAHHLPDFKNDIIDFLKPLMTYLEKRAQEDYNKENSSVLYAGIAHGWSGVFMTFIKWAHLTQTNLSPAIEALLKDHIKRPLVKDNALIWPSMLSEQNPSPSLMFCNGNTGQVIFLLECYTYFNDKKYLEMAEMTAQPLADNTQKTIGSFCCGKLGMCYALIYLYRATQNEKWLTLAVNIINTVTPQNQSFALLKGDVGTALLLNEIKSDLSAVQLPLI